VNYLVTGATGNIGGRVVEQLIAEGLRPRVLVRSAAKARALFGDRVDLVVGDLSDASSLPASFAGVDAIFLVNSGPDIARRDGAAALAAKAAGVKRLVKLSAMGARTESSTAQLGSWHASGEAAIRSSGVGFTFVQPAGFMTNALAWAASIKADGVVSAPTGDGRIAMIHPDDIAGVATHALTSAEYDGQSLPITGPHALSYREMTATIGAAIGKAIAFKPISDSEARARLVEHGGMPAAVADALVGLWQSVREGRVANVTDTVERVLGRKPHTFARWAAQNAEAFR
jgi:uncharacterized protein YbjT (DUF2867 family)